jgi:hypothetical protein
MSSAVSDDDRKESWMDRVDGARAFDVVTLAVGVAVAWRLRRAMARDTEN